MKNKFKLTLLSTLIISSSLSAEFFMNVQLQKNKNGNNGIFVDSPYDSFGFDKDGIHRSGDVVDIEGFGANGLKPDSNSAINMTLDQNLDNSYNIELSQDIVEGNFGYISGTINFSTTPLTVQSIEGNNVVLDEGLTTNPFPSGIDIIKNGTVVNNSGSANDWQNIVNVYQDVSVYYWTSFEYIHSRTAGSSNLNMSHGTLYSTTNHTATRWRVYINRNIATRPWPDRDDLIIYGTDNWASSRRTRNESQLVSSITTDYFVLNNVAVNDTIDVYMPMKLQVSIDNDSYQNVELTRENASSNQLTFELENLDNQKLNFRITDLNHSTNISNITGLNINPQNLRD
jgi:hypothetical protein